MAERGPGVEPFLYTKKVRDEIEASLSRDRLRAYLDAAGGDRETAVRLHEWNTEVSAAFYEPLQGLEVALRNAAQRRLSERYGPEWFDNPDAGLDRGAVERIADARSALKRKGYGNDPPDVVAALSFGFWVSLLGAGGRMETGRKANYEMTLWRPALRGAFAHRPKLTRKEVHRALEGLRALRNRIAHHEPILGRDLAADHDGILDIVGWMSPATRTWIAHRSRAPATIEAARMAGAFGEQAKE